MGFFDFLKRGEKKADPRQVGMYLMRIAAEEAFDGDRSLNARISRSGAAVTKSVFEYQTELLVFSAFPFDVMILMELGEKGWAVREGMIEGITEFCRQMVDEEHREGLDLSGWPDMIKMRFVEYAEVVQESESGGMSLGFLASRYITGSTYPEVAQHLVLHFTGAIKHMRDPIRHMSIK